MAMKEMEKICLEATERFREGVSKVFICHRIGFVATQEASIVVCCSGGHRDIPMQAVQWIVNAIKSRVTIWKRFVPLETSVRSSETLVDKK